MAQEHKTKDWFKRVVDNEKWRKWIILFGLVGIALIFLSGFLSGDPKTETEGQPQKEAKS